MVTMIKLISVLIKTIMMMDLENALNVIQISSIHNKVTKAITDNSLTYLHKSSNKLYTTHWICCCNQ